MSSKGSSCLNEEKDEMKEMEGMAQDKEKEEDEVRRGVGERQTPALSFAQDLYGDDYIGSQTEYYADDCFFDDWMQEDSTHSNPVGKILHVDDDVEEIEGRTREEGRKDRSKETGVESGTPDNEREDFSNAPTTTIITTEVRDTVHETTVSVVRKENRQQRRRKQKCHKQQEEREEKEGDEEAQQRRQHEEGNLGEEEQKQESHRFRRENRQRLREAQRQKKQQEKEAERVKRQEQKLEEKKRRIEEREQEREERKRAQKQDQQIRLYFAGVDAALLVALKELLQQPQFLPLRDTIVVFAETARQYQQQETRAAKPVSSTCYTSTMQTNTLDTVFDSFSQCTISPVILEEEFTAVDLLARLCPAALCIVCMPHPIQNHLQLLQSQTLVAEQPLRRSLVAPPQSEKLLTQQYVAHQMRSASIEISQNTERQSSHFQFACGSSHAPARTSNSADKGEIRNSPERTKPKKPADCGSSCLGKGVLSLEVYARFLVLPLFTETNYSHYREICSHATSSRASSSSHIVCRDSNPPRFSERQWPDESLLDRDICSLQTVVCTEDCTCSNRSPRSSCDCHFSVSDSCSSHGNPCRTATTRVNSLNENGHKSALLSLPRQLKELQEELRGAARIVCIFQGIRASLAVPQPRVNDDVGVEETNTEERFSSASLSESRNRGECYGNCDSSSAVCSHSSFSVTGCCGSGRLAPDQCTPSTAQEGGRGDKTDVGQGVKGGNMLHLPSEEQQKAKLSDPKSDTQENTGARAGSGRTKRLNVEGGNLSRADKVNYAEDKVFFSPGELDETIATLIVDCGIDCVEPPDATATADYILTAAKHMRIAHKTLGEQHMRMKKSKSFTAAEEAILAEVAYAATSTIADAARLDRPYESDAVVPPTSLQSIAKATSAGCEAPTHAARGTGDIAPLVSAPAAMASRIAAVGGMAGCPTTGGNVQTMGKKQLSTADRGELSCEDVFTGYEDVFSLACRLWGKQLVQIPTVTERVAAAVMRQYKRPAELLRRLRTAGAEEAKGRVDGLVRDAAKRASEAEVTSLNKLSSVGEKAKAAAVGDRHHALERLLVQARVLALQNVKSKHQGDTEEKSKNTPHRRLKQKRIVRGVERVVEELADIVLHAVPTNASHTKSIQAEEDIAEDAVEGASKGAGKVAKIGPARAKKICMLFSDGAPAKQ